MSVEEARSDDDFVDAEEDLHFLSGDGVDTAVQVDGIQNLTDKQKLTLNKFKEDVGDVIAAHNMDDYNLVKWLKAGRFDLKKAEHMLRESMSFRDTMGVDRMLSEYSASEVIKNYLSGGFCGYDKGGSPIKIELFGCLDMRGLMSACRRAELIKSKLYDCEWVVSEWERQSHKLGRRVDGLVVIFDMRGVSTRALWKPGLQLYLHLVQILEDNYPEMMKRMFVINAPGYFNLFWHLCKPLVSDDMRRKILVCGKNYESVLLNYIDASELPVCYGGAKMDENRYPNCAQWVCQGGEVPTDLYLEKKALIQDMESATIQAAQVCTVPLYIQNPGDILRWEFYTAHKDLDFSLVYSHSPLETTTPPTPTKIHREHKSSQNKKETREGSKTDDRGATESRDGSAMDSSEYSGNNQDSGELTNERKGQARDDQVLVAQSRVNAQSFIQDGYIVCAQPGYYTLCFDNRRSWITSKTVYYKTFIEKSLS